MNLPVTSFQEAILLAEEVGGMGTDGSWGNLPIFCELRGALDIKALETALNTIVRRHAAFRSCFMMTPSVPAIERRARLQAFASSGLFSPGLYMQRIVPEVSVPFNSVSLAGSDSELQDSGIKALFTQDNTDRFDYSRPPLLRARLVRIQSEVHFLILIVHTLICDSASTRVMLKELAAIYHSAQAREPVPELGVSVPFQEFARHEHEKIAARHFDEGVRYWLGQWETFGAAQISSHDLGRRSSKVVRGRGTASRVSVELGGELSEALLDFCRKRGIRPFVFLCTSLASALRTRTDSNLVVIWTAFANRLGTNTENSIGHYETSRFIGIECPREVTGCELLETVSQAIHLAALHQGVPSNLIWKALGGAPRPVDQLQVIFSLVGGDEPEEISMGQVEMRRIAIPPMSTYHSFNNMTLTAVQSHRRFRLKAIHAIECVSPNEVRSILRDWMMAIARLLTCDRVF